MSYGAEAGAKLTFHVGKISITMGVSGVSHAFDISRKEDGGLRITNIKIPMTDAERTHLYAHFGRSIEERSGGTKGKINYEDFETYEPGSAEHFLSAVHQLPDPYMLMGESTL